VRKERINDLVEGWLSALSLGKDSRASSPTPIQVRGAARAQSPSWTPYFWEASCRIRLESPGKQQKPAVACPKMQTRSLLEAFLELNTHVILNVSRSTFSVSHVSKNYPFPPLARSPTAIAITAGLSVNGKLVKRCLHYRPFPT